MRSASVTGTFLPLMSICITGSLRSAFSLAMPSMLRPFAADVNGPRRLCGELPQPRMAAGRPLRASPRAAHSIATRPARSPHGLLDRRTVAWDNHTQMRPDLSWTLSPGVLIGAAILAGAYLRRWRQVRLGPSPRHSAEAPVWRLCCFMAAVLLAVMALVSPIDALADQLFFAHMIPHMLLLDVVPVLAILGLTKVLLRPVTRVVHDIERRAGALAHPAFAVALYVGAIWAWHIPAAYDLAVRHPLVHILEHVSFVVAGSLYWWHLLSPILSLIHI